MLICEGSRYPSPCRPVHEPFLDQVRLVYVFDGTLVLADCRGQTLYSDGPAVEFIYQSEENFAVHLIEALLVYFKHFQGLQCGLPVDPAVPFDLGIIADPSEQPVGDPGVPRERDAISPAPESSILTDSMSADLFRIIFNSAGL